MGCQIIGPPRTYPEVRDQPAVPLCLDVSAVSNREDLKQFIGDSMDPEAIQPQPISVAERQYFGSVVAHEPAGPMLLAGSA